MRKSFFLFVFLFSAVTNLFAAETYKELWQRYDAVAKKDHPRTAIAVLDQIIARSTKEKSYGNLIKAQVCRGSHVIKISPDSMSVWMEQMKTAEAKAKDPVLKAVYAAVIGKEYAEAYDLEDNDKLSKEWFAKALKDKELLAKTIDKAYEPAVEVEDLSSMFGHDLLHVIGCEAQAYADLHHFYAARGNRRAACMTACLDVRHRRHKDWRVVHSDKFMHQLDSLMEVYRDLDEAGELAIERYNLMSQNHNVSAEDKVKYIDSALDKWGNWFRMNQLRNARAELTRPKFSASMTEAKMLLGKSGVLHINSIRDIKELTLRIYKVRKPYYDISYNHLPDKKLAEVRGNMQPAPVQTHVKRFDGREAYEVLSDSIIINPLPMGCYLAELDAGVKGMKRQHVLFYVSDITILRQRQGEEKTRFAVLNATTGQPVSAATLMIKDEDNRITSHKVDGNGEYLHTGDEDVEVRAFAGTDNWSPYSNCWGYTYYEENEAYERAEIYTDRGIYRPGQTVQAAVVAFSRKDAVTTTAIANRTMTVSLYGARSGVIAEKQVTTDKYGTASVAFELPATGLSGMYWIEVPTMYGNAYFSVEEYKRPTFRVEFDSIQAKYEVGDTVELKGHAMSFAGVPVQNGKVKIRVDRRTAMWWWRYGGRENTRLIDVETTTDTSGNFVVKVPMEVPANDNPISFYSFDVRATVTDNAGETREGWTAIPLGTRPTAFSCDIPDKVERDSLCNIRFVYTNSVGKELDGNVNYTIDGKAYTAAANRAVDVRNIIAGLPSGQHFLHAVCGTDTIDRKFVVFNVTDKTAPIDTPDWFYITSEQFTEKGKIHLQLGSSAPRQHVVYTIFSGDKVLESGTLALNGKLHCRDFVYRSEYGDGLKLTYAWVKDGNIYEHTVSLRRPLPDKRLKTGWKTFRDRLIPGQHETWTLHVSRPDGQPVSAQLTATMYDKSLDVLKSFGWSFFNDYNPRFIEGVDWVKANEAYLSMFESMPLTMLTVEELDFSQLLPMSYKRWATGMRLAGMVPGVKALGSLKIQGNAVGEVLKAKEVVSSESVALDEVVTVGYGVKKAETSVIKLEEEPVEEAEPVTMRENFNETAFFYPQLETDDKGDVNISFVLPESITTWKFKGFVHDQSMNYAFSDGEAIARKTVMVQPNMPRFVRMGDNASITTRIVNTSDRLQNGKVRMELTTADGTSVVYSRQTDFVVEANAGTTVTFDFSPAADNELLVCKIIAEGEGFSDGEQHYLPVLPDKEMVLNTIPFTLKGEGNHTIDLKSLFDKSSTNKVTTIEYTENPAWLMVQALPSLANPTGDNAVSLVAAYYANAIAAHIVGMSPAISQAMKLWKQTPEESLTSALEKDKGLKNVLLEETPWLLTAANDTERMRSLARYLDINQLTNSQTSLLEKLRKLQNREGGFSWWQGMVSSPYITSTVVETLVRLNRIVGTRQETQPMLNTAFAWLDKEMEQRVQRMREREKKGKPVTSIGEAEARYLYMSALANRKSTPTINYLLNILENHPQAYTIYGKANIAVVMSLYGRTSKAAECLQSAREYTVYKENMGRYYDTPLAEYSWSDYRIPSQVATIEALKLLTPADTTTIEEMQQWLLQEKRTTAWDTPINSVNAIYAFLQGNLAVLAPAGGKTVLYEGSKRLDTSSETPMLGTVTYRHAGQLKSVTFKKETSHTSWGAAYGQSLQPVDQIKGASSGFTVKREIISDDNELKVGSRVKVRITIRADRDYDFVQLVDKRAACLEPVNQLSGYNRNAYYVPRDNSTSYYFNSMAKGTHVVETEYFVDRSGDYRSGTCTVQCAYSPSFTGRAAGSAIHVNP